MLAYNIPSQLVIAILCILSAWLLQRIATGIFNIFFHPLAAFPGPRAAALTGWYKTYQEVCLGTSWIDVLGKLHGTYGMYLDARAAGGTD
jgi:hypothetical protein